MKRKHRDVGAAAHQAHVAALRDGRRLRATTIPHKRSEDVVAPLDRWDSVRPTECCRHCNGTGRAPGDGRTACGFCED